MCTIVHASSKDDRCFRKLLWLAYPFTYRWKNHTQFPNWHRKCDLILPKGINGMFTCWEAVLLPTIKNSVLLSFTMSRLEITQHVSSDTILYGGDSLIRGRHWPEWQTHLMIIGIKHGRPEGAFQWPGSGWQYNEQHNASAESLW